MKSKTIAGIALLLLGGGTSLAAAGDTPENRARLVQGTFNSASEEASFQRALSKELGREFGIASAKAAGDNFGVSIAVSGDTALVGAHLDDTPAGPDVGGAYVF